MNLIVDKSMYGRSEIWRLSSVPNWFISHTTSGPLMGQVDDSVIGCFELTRDNVKFDKYHAMMLVKNTIHQPSFDDGTVDPDAKNGDAPTWTGRDMVSKLLENTPINLTATPKFYSKSLAPLIKYNPSEIKVVIKDGKMVSGVLDKATIGKGASGGIYDIIARDYGNRKAIDALFDMQQMAIAYILQFGYTIGVQDLILPTHARVEIDKIASDIMNKSQLITDQLNNGEIIPPIGETVESTYEKMQIDCLKVFDDFVDPILRNIDVNNNNLLKLILSGSKGTVENMLNMLADAGQKLLNGKRMQTNFGYERALPYTRRFDTDPGSRGYIANGYINGMTPIEYIFNAMNSRFDLITKALSTSITGAQNRNSIKNLETIIINNYLWCTKDRFIIQLAYGEDFMDARKVERVKFPTVMISDKAFNDMYRYDVSDKDTTEAKTLFENEYKQLKEDRDKYRKIFFNIENINTTNLISDTRHMPINVDRIIEYSASMGSDPSHEEVVDMVKTVDVFCKDLPYLLINEIQAKKRASVPDYISSATWLLSMLVRTSLCSRNLINRKINPARLQIILDRIRIKYTEAIIEPGTAVGIIAAQAFSEPLTQYMLDAHHRSAAGGTSKSGITRAKEILGARDVDQMAAPQMIIHVKPEYAHNKAKVQEIANNIEVMKLVQFVSSWQIFFEKYGSPVHPLYVGETSIINEFTNMNPLLKRPADLINWCVRLQMNKTALILKNMSVDLIIKKLHEVYPETFIVYTPENARNVVIRIYMRNIMFKQNVELGHIVTFKNSLLDTTIRGVNGIINTSVIEIVRNKISEDGSIVRDKDRFAITTTGTNMRGLMINKYIDVLNLQTDAIQEIARTLGIEAARQKIISELGGLVECNIHHRTVYADEMTYTGNVTSIEKSGLAARESHNIALRIGFSSPIQTIEKAALGVMETSIKGVTAPLIVGSIPQLGSTYNSFYVNEEMVKKHVKKASSYLDDL